MATHSSILAWEPHGQRILVGYSPRDHKESDTTERLTLLLLEKCLFKSFVHLKIELCFGYAVLKRSWSIPETRLCYQIHDLQIFSPICGLSLDFLHSVLWFTWVCFLFMKSNLFSYFTCVFSLRTLYQIQSYKDLSLCFKLYTLNKWINNLNRTNFLHMVLSLTSFFCMDPMCFSSFPSTPSWIKVTEIWIWSDFSSFF